MRLPTLESVGFLGLTTSPMVLSNLGYHFAGGRWSETSKYDKMDGQEPHEKRGE
jgi:hypothetical protein